jgi:hypothetical protein
MPSGEGGDRSGKADGYGEAKTQSGERDVIEQKNRKRRREEKPSKDVESNRGMDMPGDEAGNESLGKVEENSEKKKRKSKKKRLHGNEENVELVAEKKSTKRRKERTRDMVRKLNLFPM